MTNAVAIALLSSFTLFLGLSALARRRMQAERPGLGGVLALLAGVTGVGWMLLSDGLHTAAPVFLIGVLGYCFGHFTTSRRASTSKSGPSSQLP